MDPNEALRKIRVEVREVLHGDQADVERLAGLVEALDGWLSRGGFPPEEWREGPDAVGEDSAGSGAALSRMAMGRDDDYRPEAVDRDNG